MQGKYTTAKALIAIAILMVIILPEKAHAATMSWLHTQDNQILNEQGNIVVLKGVNLEQREWLWNSNPSISYERKAIPIIANEWKGNAIIYAFASGPVNRNNQTYLAQLDELINIDNQYGIYSILSYRYSEPNTTQPDMPDQAAEDAVVKLADRYKTEPSVIISLQVEPHDVTWQELKPRLTSMVQRIRAVNPKVLILIPGTQWSRYIHWALTDPIPGTNLVYKIHYYDGYNVVESSYQLSKVAAKLPVILGEFGTGSVMSQSDVDNLMNKAETLRISQIAWLFNDVGCPCLLDDKVSFTTTPYGESVKDGFAQGVPNPQPPSVPPINTTLPGPDQALFCVDENYTGKCVLLNVGVYNYDQQPGVTQPFVAGGANFPNDALTSIKVGNNVVVNLYEHCAPSMCVGTGRIHTVTSDTLRLPSSFNNQTSSVVVRLKSSTPENYVSVVVPLNQGKLQIHNGDGVVINTVDLSKAVPTYDNNYVVYVPESQVSR